MTEKNLKTIQSLQDKEVNFILGWKREHTKKSMSQKRKKKIPQLETHKGDVL